jgi:acetyl-CoA acyltransferase
MTAAVICAYARSPFTFAHKGALARVRPDDLAANTIKGLIEKSNVKPEDIEDIILGCAFPEGEQGWNMGRMLVLLADLPINVSGTTVNRWCGSSMTAIHMAAGAIAAGAGDAFICAGVESMTRIPMGGFNPMPNPQLYESMPAAYMSMGLTAEEVSKKYKVSREDQEKFALTSHQKAGEADLSKEIIPFGDVKQDGCIRADSTLEALAGLNPAFDVYGTVTAGTSSPLTDGASAVLVCSEDYAKKNKLPMLARIKSIAVAGLEPEIMGMGPLHAGNKALERAGIKAKNLDIIELNEAFAAQSIPCIQELGLDASRVNMEGGAIALGHPLGASGARITGKAAQLLHDHKGKYALATMCVGGGQGTATVLETI